MSADPRDTDPIVGLLRRYHGGELDRAREDVAADDSRLGRAVVRTRTQTRLAPSLLVAALVGLAIVIAGASLLRGQSNGTAATPAASPTVLPIGVAIGSEIDCRPAAMKRHCDIWTAAAIAQSSLPKSDVTSTAVHIAWSTVMRTLDVAVAVELRRSNGSTEFVPLFCGPGNWEAMCDTSDVSMPPQTAVAATPSNSPPASTPQPSETPWWPRTGISMCGTRAFYRVGDAVRGLGTCSAALVDPAGEATLHVGETLDLFFAISPLGSVSSSPSSLRLVAQPTDRLMSYQAIAAGDALLVTTNAVTCDKGNAQTFGVCPLLLVHVIP